MNPIPYPRIFTFFVFLFLSVTTKAQSFGTEASAVWISDCNQSNYFNTSGSGSDLFGPSANSFSNNDFGVHTQNSGTLVIRGASIKTFKGSAANVCNARMYYRVYLQTATPGTFNPIDLPLTAACNATTNQYPSGGSCNPGDQKWSLFIDDGETGPFLPIDLTTLAPGKYVMELYYEVTGSSSGTSLCDENVLLNNGGVNYKAFFSIQAPRLASANPTTCKGTEGTITISGLVPGSMYAISYADNGISVGPNNLVASGIGEVNLSGLNAGVYSDFALSINGCTTDLNTALTLSDPVLTPKFNKIAPFCAGSTPPVLPATSVNGVSGTWNPAVINNQTSGSYTFTPASGQCGIPHTISVTVNPNRVPVFNLGSSLMICSGGIVPSLPTTSVDGITGNWTPAIVSNTTSGTYIFKPSPGQCATSVTFSVSINPNITPSFSFGSGLTICAGSVVPLLPSTSGNGIAGTWNPTAIDNQTSATYTFTPDAGQCASVTTLNVTVNPTVTPAFSFGTSLTICNGGAVPVLPNTSTNGITGIWNPWVVDNQVSDAYTFTPASGQCATTTTFAVILTPKTIPTFDFGTSLNICEGNAVPMLPSTSGNGISGTWSPSVVDNSTSGIYTFTPSSGLCATITTFNVTVSPIITPAFDFGTSQSICAGSTVPTLSTTSNNGIIGAWSPSVISNQNSGSYTFTPAAGQCAKAISLTVTVNPVITPTFDFGTSQTICVGDVVPTLPNISNNGINGTWSAIAVSNQTSGLYTFTPDPGQCALAAAFSVIVNPKVKPAFNFGTSLIICSGGAVPILPGTSVDKITGSWSPATVDNTTSGTYTFTPASGQCAVTTTFIVIVNSNITPAFDFGTSLTVCSGTAVPALPVTSNNGINGVWTPAVIDNNISGTYSFTPAAGQCALSTTLNVMVTSTIIPTFSFGKTLSICTNAAVPVLPATSTNGITGVWSPAIASNQTSGVYTFTPTVTPGQCVAITTFAITVNPIVTPKFSFGTALIVCSGSTPPVLPAISQDGISGTWSPAVIDNQNSGVYTFTTAPGQCATASVTLTVTVPPVPTVSSKIDTTVNDGVTLPSYTFYGTPTGVNYTWTNSNPSIGLPASGNGDIPSFTTANKGSSPVSATITVTPKSSGCSGIALTYKITVIPLDKDLFVPNVFSPNGDGKNDVLYVYGNYIDKLNMRIFNQWGQVVGEIDDKTKGWDGKYKGRAQPVGVYVYVLQAIMNDGRTIKLKGSITLLR